MRNYIVGRFYEFVVTSFYTDKDDSGYDTMWFYLSEGGSPMRYSVPAYPFQQSGWENRTIQCRVIDVKTNGYPFLEQKNTEEILNHLYTPGELYWFNVVKFQFDSKSNKCIYNLFDRERNITHRFYSDRIDLIGLVSFSIIGINEKGYLDLKFESSACRLNNRKDSKKLLQNPFGHEDAHKEFKSSIVFHPGDNAHPNVAAQMQVILKSISGFQNAEGGQLYIGVTDDGGVRGIEGDYAHLKDDGDTNTYHWNTDGFEQKIRNSVNDKLGKQSLDNIKFNFFYQSSSKHTFCVITINKTKRPVFLDDMRVCKRFGNEFRWLKGDEITNLVNKKNKDKSKQKKFKLQIPSDCIEVNPNYPLEDDGVTSDIGSLSGDPDYYFISFFNDSSFIYSHKSHSSEAGFVTEVSFDKKDGNIEYQRNILVKSTEDGNIQLIHANDLCKLGEPDSKITIENTSMVFRVIAVQKYGFLKVIFCNGSDEREKIFRVISLFNDDTSHAMSGRLGKEDILRWLSRKGVSVIPEGYKLKELSFIPESLPSSLRLVSINGYSGSGRPLDSKDDYDTSMY